MTWIYIASGISITLVIGLWYFDKKKAAKKALDIAEALAKITPPDFDDDAVEFLRDIVDEDK